MESALLANALTGVQLDDELLLDRQRNLVADRIREELLEKGVVLEDTKSGVRWKRKSP